MELSEVTVQTTASLRLPWQETLVLPVGDLQLGAPGCDIDRFKRHMEWGMEHGAYFLGMGDYVDVASPSNRQAIRSIDVYDSVTEQLEEGAAAKVGQFLDLVRGSEGRWLGLLEGHHFWPFMDGTTSDVRIAQQLRAPFLGTCAFVRLRFADKSNHKLTCTIWCHHGSGSGSAQAAPLTKLERLVGWFEADIYLMGHYSRKGALPVSRLYMADGGRLRHKKLILASTGGFVKAYDQGSRVSSPYARGGYAERGLMTPTALGGVGLYIRPARDSNGNARLDLTAEV
jgi:hypothetical protein